jgi:hypothetical protein
MAQTKIVADRKVKAGRNAEETRAHPEKSKKIRKDEVADGRATSEQSSRNIVELSKRLLDAELAMGELQMREVERTRIADSMKGLDQWMM